MSGEVSLRPLPRVLESLSNSEFHRLCDKHPNYSRSIERCETCKGAKSFRWWDSERTRVVTYSCPCPDQYLLGWNFLAAGIGDAYQRLDWPDLYETDDTESLVFALDYLEHAENYFKAGVGLYLYGPQGTGKSSLACLILKKAIVERGVKGYFTSFAHMFSALMEGFDDPDVRKWFDSRVRNAGLLVVDDVGREYGRKKQAVAGEGMKEGPSAAAKTLMDEVLRHRVASSLPTIVTTNLTPDDIATEYGGNVLGLLYERSLDYEVQGRNFRQRAKERLIEEAQQGLRRPVVW